MKHLTLPSGAGTNCLKTQERLKDKSTSGMKREGEGRSRSKRERESCKAWKERRQKRKERGVPEERQNEERQAKVRRTSERCRHSVLSLPNIPPLSIYYLPL